VVVTNVSTQQKENFSVQQRLLVVVEQGAEATLVEQFVTTAESQNVFANNLTEIELAPNAKLEHYRLHLEEENTIHIGAMHAAIASDARLDSFHLGLGGKIKRVDIVVNHIGRGSECELNGIYLPVRSQHIDYHTSIEHREPHGTTRETFRGIVADKAKAVFNGRIHIHRDAQKVSAELHNMNLLTSHEAEVDTKPELEIYADDVTCAHGATVAQIDEKLLYYMQSRGISLAEAEIMLSFGFINELINEVHVEALQGYLRPKVAALFGRKVQDA
jgi:Fe-S cluster assembly protein SufD